VIRAWEALRAAWAGEPLGDGLDRWYHGAVAAAILVLPSGYAGYVMAALLALIVVDLATGRFRWVPVSFEKAAGALVAAALASGLASAWRWPSTGLAGLFGLMLLVTIYPAARLLRGRPRVVRWWAGVWVAGGAVAAAWGIARAVVFWPNGASTPALGENALGTSLIAVIALVLGGWTVWNAPRARGVLAAVLIASVAALELTWSRAAWGAAALAAAITIALAPRQKAALIALSVISVVVATWTVGAGRQILERHLGTLTLEANYDRVAIWKAAVRMWRDHPVLGTGYGSFATVWPDYEPDPALYGKPTAHNLVLNFAAETGTVGLAAFVALVGSGLRGLWNRVRGSRGDPASDGLWAGLFAAAVGVLAQQIFDGTVMSWHVGYGLILLFTLGGLRG